MKIIFLDIDGVLTTKATKFQLFDKKCVTWLKHVFRSTDAQLIISSSWRYDMVKVNGFLQANGLPIAIGITPLNDEKRGEQILECIKEHPSKIEKWITIDDTASALESVKSRLVKTIGAYGLTMKSAKRAIYLLNQ